jgi:hypothetical protein
VLRPTNSEDKNMKSKLCILVCMLALALPAMALTTTNCSGCNQCSGDCCKDCSSCSSPDCCGTCC